MHNYKRFENSAVQKVKRGFVIMGWGIGSFFKLVFKGLTKQYTIVLVPHSEKKVYNLRISVLAVLCMVIALGGLGLVFFYYGASQSGDTKIIFSDKDSRLRDTQASLDQMRDETARLMKGAKSFEDALSSTLSSLGVDSSVYDSQASENGDLSSFFDIQETSEGTLQEVNDIQRLTNYLERAVPSIKELGALLNSQSALLTEIPSIWPIKGGIGHISFPFGQQENPFTGQYYIHKGTDLSTYRQGDPVVATADGTVVTVDYDAGGFGNYIIIKHKHGFYTRYGHLLSARVRTGQRVQQNEVIGYIGNTGLSTGPHLHYEVHIGADVVDPKNYLNIRASLTKGNK
jgi:murein DD-endopeptidase MepM/ murein hydrolase activator NlpD